MIRKNIFNSVFFLIALSLCFYCFSPTKAFSDTKNETEITGTFVREITPGCFPENLNNIYNEQEKETSVKYDEQNKLKDKNLPKTNDNYNYISIILGILVLFVYFLMMRRETLNEEKK